MADEVHGVGYHEMSIQWMSTCILDGHGCSKATLDGKRGENKHHGVDQGPNKGYPRRHLEVARLVNGAESAGRQCWSSGAMWYSQPAHNTPGNNAFNAGYDSIDDGSDPYGLPVPPLHHAGPGSDNHVHGAEEHQRP